MICSVKFFEPIVIATPLLSGFSSIRAASVSPPELVSSPLSSSSPQAVAPIESANAASSASRSLSGSFVDMRTSLGVDSVALILCALGGGGPGELQPPRRDQTLQARQRELDRDRQQRDKDRPREDALFPVHVAG